MDKIVRINMGAEEGPKATEEPLGDYAGLGGRGRLRPILMTAFTTALALVPMAVGFGEGSEMNAPLARVVIGGMLVSALFTMFFVPTLYTSIKGIGKQNN